MPNTTTSLLVLNPVNVNALANKELRINVNKMIKATAGMNRDMWSYAIAVHNIISQELHKDDFKNLDSFAKAMDTTKSTLSKYDNAVEIMNKLVDYGYDVTNMSYTNAYLLSSLKEDFTAFMELYREADLGKMTKSQLEKLIKKFQGKDVVADIPKKSDGDEVTGEAETEAKAEETEAKKGSIEAVIIDGILSFTYRKKLYNVPVKELKDYIVE